MGVKFKATPGGKYFERKAKQKLMELIAYCEPSLEPPKINLYYHNPKYYNHLVEKYDPDEVDEFCERYIPVTSEKDWRPHEQRH